MRAWLAAAVVLMLAAPAHANPPKLAVFDFGLIDMSLQGQLREQRKDEQQRSIRMSELLRKQLAESGKFQLVDIAPVNAAAHDRSLQDCGGCDVRYAQRLGADLVITGVVQKASALLLVMSLYLRDAHTGRLVAAMNANFQGDTDESWARATSYLVRNRLLAPNYGAPQSQ